MIIVVIPYSDIAWYLVLESCFKLGRTTSNLDRKDYYNNHVQTPNSSIGILISKNKELYETIKLETKLYSEDTYSTS
jgi:hypothetical protein